MSKKKINNKLKKFLSIKEVVMLSLVLANFVFLGMEHFDKLSRSQLLAVEVLDVIIACMFLAEFSLSFILQKTVSATGNIMAYIF